MSAKAFKTPKEPTQKRPRSPLLKANLTRAGVGLAVTGCVVAGIVLVGSVALPSIELTPAAAEIDTSSSSTRVLACAGSALDLGGDPSNPLLGISTGMSEVTVHDAANAQTTDLSFARESDAATGGGSFGMGSGIALEVGGDDAYAVAMSESEQVAADTLGGFMATQCLEPSNESWIVGGTTTLGSVTLLSLTNPGVVPATVFVRVFDQEGLVESLQSAGVVVPPQSQRTVSINGAAPERASLAVHVLSRGAKIVTTMQESLVEGLAPVGLDTIQGAEKPSTSLVIPGITSAKVEGVETVDEHGNDEAGHTLRLLAPGDTGGMVTVIGVDETGETVPLVSDYLQAGVVADFPLTELTEEFGTVLVDAEVPVVGAVSAFVIGSGSEDIAWFAAAPMIDREIPVAVPNGPSPSLALYNPGDGVLTVQLVAGEGNQPEANQRVSIPAKASVRVPVNPASGYQLLTDAPVFAALSFEGDGVLSSFPIVPPLTSADTVLVYTR